MLWNALGLRVLKEGHHQDLKKVCISLQKMQSNSFFFLIQQNKKIKYHIPEKVSAETILFWIRKFQKIQKVDKNFNFLPNKLIFCCGNYSKSDSMGGNTIYISKFIVNFNIQRPVQMTWSTHTVFPHIVSTETILFWLWPYVLWPLITVHKCAETIQGRKLYEEIRYSKKATNTF